MWYYSYTSMWFDRIVKDLLNAKIPLERTKFALVLTQEINTDLREFLKKHYEALDKSSSLSLQIFAPVKPPNRIYDDSFGPDFPLESHEERYSFFESLKKAGVSQHDLPKIIFFSLRKKDDETYEFVNVMSLSLRKIEHGGRVSYKEFFSEMVNIAHDCYMNERFDPEQFSKEVTRRFGLMFLEEKLCSVPILGEVYKKRIG